MSRELYNDIRNTLMESVVEEFTFANADDIADFLSLLAYVRDNVNLTYLHQASISRLWSVIRDPSSGVSDEVIVGRLTYRFFSDLCLVHTEMVFTTISEALASSSGRAYTLHKIEDVNKEGLIKESELRNLLYGNPWFMFLMIAENNMSTIKNTLLKED